MPDCNALFELNLPLENSGFESEYKWKMNWNAKRIEIGSSNLILSTRLWGFSSLVLFCK